MPVAPVEEDHNLRVWEEEVRLEKEKESMSEILKDASTDLKDSKDVK